MNEYNRNRMANCMEISNLLINLHYAISGRNSSMITGYLARLEPDKKVLVLNILTGNCLTCAPDLLVGISSGSDNNNPVVTLDEFSEVLLLGDDSFLKPFGDLCEKCSPEEVTVMKGIISGNPDFRFGRVFLAHCLAADELERFVRTSSFSEAVGDYNNKAFKVGFPYIPVKCLSVNNSQLSNILDSGDLSQSVHCGVELGSLEVYVQVHIQAGNYCSLFDESGRLINHEVPTVVNYINSKLGFMRMLTGPCIIEGYMSVRGQQEFRATDCVLFEGKDVTLENISMRKMHAKYIMGEKDVATSRLVVASEEVPEPTAQKYLTLTRVNSPYNIGGCSTHYMRRTIQPNQSAVVKLVVVGYTEYVIPRITDVTLLHKKIWTLVFARYNIKKDEFIVIGTGTKEEGLYFRDKMFGGQLAEKPEKVFNGLVKKKVNWVRPEVVMTMEVLRDAHSVLRIGHIYEVFPFCSPEQCDLSEVC